MTNGITASPCLLQSTFGAASSRSITTTREPAATMASVLANPMPDAAPVTAATLPSNSLAICLHLAGVTKPECKTMYFLLCRASMRALEKPEPKTSKASSRSKPIQKSTNCSVAVARPSQHIG
jgi:hypothetical protein